MTETVMDLDIELPEGPPSTTVLPVKRIGDMSKTEKTEMIQKLASGTASELEFRYYDLKKFNNGNYQLIWKRDQNAASTKKAAPVKTAQPMVQQMIPMQMPQQFSGDQFMMMQMYAQMNKLAEKQSKLKDKVKKQKKKLRKLKNEYVVEEEEIAAPQQVVEEPAVQQEEEPVYEEQVEEPQMQYYQQPQQPVYLSKRDILRYYGRMG